jgi:uracil phosphoribosyltransferase
MSNLPPNVHVSQHPCLLAKLSQLRSKGTAARDVKGLIHDITLIVGCEALAKGLTSVSGPTVRQTPPLPPSHMPCAQIGGFPV